MCLLHLAQLLSLAHNTSLLFSFISQIDSLACSCQGRGSHTAGVVAFVTHRL